MTRRIGISENLVVASPESPQCDIVIPGIGQCEVLLGSHKSVNGRVVHRHGPVTWNGGALIEVDDKALREAAKPGWAAKELRETEKEVAKPISSLTNPQFEGRDV